MKYKANKALTMVQQFFPKVRTVEDSNKPVMVEITQSDNDNALVKNHTTCALAVACKRAARADGVLIGTQTAYVIHGTRAIRFRLGPSISREIVSFDREAGFDNGWYKLCAPCESARLGRERSDKRHGETGAKTKVFKHFTSGVRTSLQKL